MGAATIDSAVLDLLADARVAECVGQLLDEERRVQDALIAKHALTPNDNAGRRQHESVTHFARGRQRQALEKLEGRLLRLVQEAARAERSQT